MRENLIKTILGFYDQNGEFQKNDRYSDRYQSVYTKPDDNLHWLVAIPHDNNRLEIHQTDEHATFNFLVSIMYSQLFNLLCDKADDVYGGRLPIHVRCLLDEFANIGQIPRQYVMTSTL